ncbi:DUF4406 domain-containing protein [Pseudomonas aeruginosa]
MMHRVDLSGPMTGIPDFNYPAFNAEEKRIRALGYFVENPAVNMVYRGAPWEAFMRDGIKRLMDCDILALLPGWERSRGANIERGLAITLGMRVVDAEALPPPDFVCKCRTIQFTCCSVPSDNDPFVCRRLAGMPAYLSRGINWQPHARRSKRSPHSPTSLPAVSVWTCSRSPSKPFPRAALLRKRHVRRLLQRNRPICRSVASKPDRRRPHSTWRRRRTLDRGCSSR